MVLVAIVLIGKGLVFILLLRKLASPIMETNLQHKTLKKKEKEKFSRGSQRQGKTCFSKRADSCLHSNVEESSKSASLFLVVIK